MSQPEISLVIPAFNEAERLPSNLDELFEFLDGFEHETEVLIVDDGSTDGTANLVRDPARALVNEVNHGKGFAVRQGMLEAKGKIRVFMDVDLAVPPRFLHDLIERVHEGNDIVIGSRHAKGSEVNAGEKQYRRTMGVIFNKLVRIFAVGGIGDTQCGFKGFTAEAADQLFSRQKLDGFAFDVELLYMARRFGHQILEMPVEWNDSETTKIRPLVDSAIMFKDILRVRWMHRGEKWER
ncbi:MAG: glycosyltransferase family 2 protein [Planctomycetota bacterium]|nr:glycosyltransferase family 2 protein [Planctomycetota bacterium]